MTAFRGGMLHPDLDPPDQPFSYFWHPTDVVGTFLAPVASEVTPEGYLYTGSAEWMLYTGNPPQPASQRIKTLYRGYLPIVTYSFTENDLLYHVRILAVDVGGPLAGLPVNLACVSVENPTAEQRTAFVTTACRFSAPVDHLKGPVPSYRFGQRFDLMPNAYTDGQTTYDPTWTYSFSESALLRDGRILYTFPTTPKPDQAAMAIQDSGLRAIRYFSGEVQDNTRATVKHTPHTPMGTVMYRLAVPPGGQSPWLTYRVPVIPVPAGGEEEQRVQNIDPEKAFTETVHEWEERLNPCPIRVPEKKVQNYLLANTAFNLLAVDRVDGDLIMNVNTFQYHRLYPGNGANMCVALDYMGHADIAEKCLRTVRKVQFDDGSVRNLHAPDNQSFEITGYAMWSWARHAELSGDQAFLQHVYPGVQKAVRWLQSMCAKDPAGLLPPATVADDAMLANVRQTGMSLWVLIAMKAAGRMAAAVGNDDDAEAFRKFEETYRRAFEAHLAPQLERSGGVIPPAMEKTLDGNRWDDLLLLYPEILFAVDDPRVTATIQDSRQHMSEGILHFGWLHAVGRDSNQWPDVQRQGLPTVKADNWIFDASTMLHYWQTPNNAQNDLVRGTPQAQEHAVRDLYALLLHTSSTHAPQEFGTFPWSTRDYLSQHNILPDGAASAKTIELIRNMLVREQDNDLVLFSALSPAWVTPGKTLEIADEPTAFGPVSLQFTGASRADTWCWTLHINPAFRQPPHRMLLRIPWFVTLDEALVDGEPQSARNAHLSLPPKRTTLELHLTPSNPLPALSFKNTVQSFKAAYRQRYKNFLRTGNILPDSPPPVP